MEKQKNEKLVQIVYAGLFAAMTALLTATLHIPVGNGYIHCGDAMIYLSATMLPLLFCLFFFKDNTAGDRVNAAGTELLFKLLVDLIDLLAALCFRSGNRAAHIFQRRHRSGFCG